MERNNIIKNPIAPKTTNVIWINTEDNTVNVFDKLQGWVQVSGGGGGNTDIKDLPDSTGLRDTWSGKQDILTAGDNIEITSDGKISATDTTYVASDFDIKDLADSTGLREEWSGKQDALIEVVENGFYIVDSNNNIGFYVDEQGYHGINSTPQSDVVELFSTTF